MGSDTQATPQRRLDTPLGRLLLLALLMLLLQVPAQMIESVIGERQSRRDQAVEEIIGKWGGAQTLAGPVLRVPFTARYVEINGKGQSIHKTRPDAAYFLPRTLNIQADAQVELRRRGLFQVPVYVGRVQLDGEFDAPDFSAWDVAPGDIDWPRAELMVLVSQPRSLHADAALNWEGRALRLMPSTGQSGHWSPAGIHAPLPAARGGRFSLALGFNGAQGLHFSPTAEDTRVRLSANWPHPSFQGGWLPESRELQKEAFSAAWSVSYLGRDYPQRWREAQDLGPLLQGTTFGADFSDPVDSYRMTARVTKYAVMVMLFTFAVVWLTEVLSSTRVHLIQYAFTGAALCLFGLLQLSLAEHVGFGGAFGVAAAAVVGLVTLYGRAMLGRTRRALGVGAVLSLLYGYLYMIIRAEDYALLGGSLALFLGLAAAMYLTRRIDWFNPEPRQ